MTHLLRKTYLQMSCFGLSGSGSSEVAVNNSSFLVEKNNIFGLLGPNGAGKTSTIKLIIGRERPTNGLIQVNGQTVDSNDIHKYIGYCPQHNTLWNEITLKEHLRLFAAIRGIRSQDIDNVCDR